MSKASKEVSRRGAPVAVITAATAAAVAAAAAAAALSLIVRTRNRRWRHRCRQQHFRQVFSDTTDQPFPHLPPQIDDDRNTDAASIDPGRAGQRRPDRPVGQADVRAADAASDLRTGGSRGVGTTSATASGPLVHPYLGRIQGLMAATECKVPQDPPPPPPPLPPPDAAAWDVTQRRGTTRGSVPGFEVHWVSRPKDLHWLGQRLRQERQVALDTEASPLICYHGLVCLLQLAVWDSGGGTGGGPDDGGGGGGSSSAPADERRGRGGGGGVTVWLVDALALHDHMGPALGALMADPRVVKVVHGGGNDMVWLQRDFRLYAVNVFDTEKASQVLGYETRALSALLRRHCGLDLAAEKAAGQRADWRRRPLPRYLLRYAAADVAYLPYLADVLRLELAARALLSAAEGPAVAADPAAAPPRDASREGSRAAVETGSQQFVTAPLLVMVPLQLPPQGDQQQQQRPPQREGQQSTGQGAEAGHSEAEAPTDPSFGGTCMPYRPTPTPLGHAMLRSHQLSLTLYRKPVSDARAAAAAAAVAATAAAAASGGSTAAVADGGSNAAAALTVPMGTATAAAAAVLRKFFAASAPPSATPSASASASARAPASTPASAPASVAGKASPAAAGALAATAAAKATAAAVAAEVADAVLALCRWRDATARRLDVGPQLLLPVAALAALAASRPPPADGKSLLRVVSTWVDTANLALQDEPFAARYEICTALRAQADALSRLLVAAAAGRLLSAGTAGAAGIGSDADVYGGPGILLGSRPAGVVAAAGVGRRARNDPGAAQQRRSWLIEKFSAKTQVYQNCRMLSQEGQLLCYCDARKLAWYLAKGLAVQVCEDPPTIQLLFEHQNTDQQMGADDFYTQSKANRCVACGCSSHYLRYRVLPACYRRHMPPALKSHRSHDVVLLCIDCHERAQKAAELMKRQVALEYGIPLLPPRTALPRAAVAAPGPAVCSINGGADNGNGSSSSAPRVTAGDNGGGGRGDNGAHGGSDHAKEAGGGDAEGGGDADGSGCDSGSVAGGSGGGADDDGEVTAAGGLAGGIHPSAARRAALALQKSGAKMPLQRIRQLEGVIKSALGRDPGAEEPGLRPGDLEAALLAGLGRRGRNKYYRAQNQQQQQQQQPQQPSTVMSEDGNGSTEADGGGGDGSADAAALPAGSSGVGIAGAGEGRAVVPRATETTTTTTAPTVPARDRAVDPWLDSGHQWHGERVVGAAMQRGGEEELLQLIKRFRACFVQAVRPQYLPPAWGVDHSARRDFGPYSVYASERRRLQQAGPGQEGGEEGGAGHEAAGSCQEQRMGMTAGEDDLRGAAPG